MRLKTNLGTLRDMFYPVSVLADECRLNISSDGIRAKSVDPSNIALIDLTLPKEVFDSYEITKDLMVGLDFSRYNRKIKIGNKSEIVDVKFKAKELLSRPSQKLPEEIIEGVEPVLYEVSEMVLEYDDFKDRIALLDPSSIRKEPKIPNIPNAVEITMPLKRFNKIIKKSEQISDYIKFTVSDNLVFESFAGDGIDEVYSKTTNSMTGCGIKVLELPDIKFPIESIYAIDYLVKMEKAIRPKSMKEYEKSSVTLRFNTDYPLEITFGICKYGIGRYLLAPRVEPTG